MALYNTPVVSTDISHSYC